MELTFEEFKKVYEPVQQSERKGINRYLINIKDPELVEVDGKATRKGKLNNENLKNHYDMYIWTLTEDLILISGKNFINPVGYVVCKVPHDVEEKVIVNF